jgi:hypothetical protein
MILNREPVAILNAFRLVLLAGMSFGLNLTDTQLIAVMTAFEAILTLLTRSQVAPTAVVTAALKMPTGSTVAEAVEESKNPTAITTRKIGTVRS